MRIPIIDLETQPEAEALATMDRACRDTGFFVLKGHGVPGEVLEATLAEARRFFRLSAQGKMALWTGGDVADRGYFPMGNQSLDPGAPRDLSEYVMLGLDLPRDHPLVEAGTPMYGPNPWPDGLPGWRETMTAYHDATMALGRRMLRLVARNLGLPQDHFEPLARTPVVSLKLAWYPERPADSVAGQHGAGMHTDWGALTFVAGDGTPGLQVCTQHGEWLDVPALPGSYIVNVGDMLQRWTNDHYVSAPHRVLSEPGRERFSLVTFFDMDYHAPLECFPSCVSRERPARYAPMLAGDYLLHRFEESLAEAAPDS
ncbi:MAG TPA: 2-oxoglutarate and iron-dependent oxygenase domain-containing protein [Pseudohaliea sp.]|nr:2-oxoglutarate and iron-dependent oxygenase domain-containing protein [Pseudohaliea sp.]